MSQNILVTGAVGYIGGSLIDRFLHTNGPIQGAHLYAAVRSEDQVASLSKLNVTPIILDVYDEQALKQAVLQYEIDIFINTVASFVPSLVRNMAKALGERKKVSERPVYLIHSGVITLFSAEAGWPYGEIKDTDTAIYEKEKKWGLDHPVRETDLVLVEEAAAHGVSSLNVIVPVVYGRGSGEGRKISTPIPAHIRASLANRVVHKFDNDSAMPHVHISDLVSIYTILVEKILRKESVPTGESGYYFAFAHRASQWAVMEAIADSLHKRGLVSEARTKIWPDDATAARDLGFPVQYVRAMCTTRGEQIAENAARLGWKPEWDEKRFFENLDDEVQAALELDTVRPRLFEPLGVKNE